jgi:hypothetical protein
VTGAIASIAVDGLARAHGVRRDAARDVLPAASAAVRPRVLEAVSLGTTGDRRPWSASPFQAQVIGQEGTVLTDARHGFDRYAAAQALGRPVPGVSGGTHWYA